MIFTQNLLNGNKRTYNRRYVVVNSDNDGGYDFCIGVFDTIEAAYGKMLSHFIDSDRGDNVTMEWLEDDSNDGWELFIFTTPAQEGKNLELKDFYRFYYLDEEIEKEENKT